MNLGSLLPSSFKVRLCILIIISGILVNTSLLRPVNSSSAKHLSALTKKDNHLITKLLYPTKQKVLAGLSCILTLYLMSNKILTWGIDRGNRLLVCLSLLFGARKANDFPGYCEPLHYTIKKNQFAIARMLMQLGIKLSDDKTRYLFKDALNRNNERIKFLLNEVFDLEKAINNDPCKWLTPDLKNVDCELLSWIISHNPELAGEIVEKQYLRDYERSLFTAIEEGRFADAHMLMQLGIKLSDDKTRYLFKDALNRNNERIKFLLSEVFDLEKAINNDPCKWLLTPDLDNVNCELLSWITSNNPELADEIVEKQYLRDYEHSLSDAIEEGRFADARMLIQLGIKLSDDKTRYLFKDALNRNNERIKFLLNEVFNLEKAINNDPCKWLTPDLKNVDCELLSWIISHNPELAGEIVEKQYLRDYEHSLSDAIEEGRFDHARTLMQLDIKLSDNKTQDPFKSATSRNYEHSLSDAIKECRFDHAYMLMQVGIKLPDDGKRYLFKNSLLNRNNERIQFLLNEVFDLEKAINDDPCKWLTPDLKNVDCELLSWIISHNPELADKIIKKQYFNKTQKIDILRYFAKHGNLAGINLMLAHGVPPNVANHKRKTALDMASEEGHGHIVNQLLLTKVFSATEIFNALSTALTQWKETPRETIDTFIANGFDINSCNSRGIPILQHIIELDKQWTPKAVAILLERGARIDCVDCQNKTPLIYAVHKFCDAQRHVYSNAFLLYGTVQPNDLRKERNALRQHETLVHYLVEQGANIAKRANRGVTALAISHRSANKNLFNYLAANVTQKTYDQNTDQCPVCFELPHDLGLDKCMVLPCCANFICTTDYSKIMSTKKSGRNQWGKSIQYSECPLCRATYT